MQITKNFSLDEFVFSHAAIRHNIDMTPPEYVVENLTRLVENILQPLRDGIGAPVKVTSGYRPLQLNRIIGSKDTSAHVHGCAADIKVKGKTPLEIAQFIEEHFLYYVDQVIHEFGVWVHVGIAQHSRHEMLTAKLNAGGGVIYVRGLEAV